MFAQILSNSLLCHSEAIYKVIYTIKRQIIKCQRGRLIALSPMEILHARIQKVLSEGVQI